MVCTHLEEDDEIRFKRSIRSYDRSPDPSIFVNVFLSAPKTVEEIMIIIGGDVN